MSYQSKNRKNYHHIIAIWIACGFVLTQFSMSLYLPTMPALMSVFHSTQPQIMLTLSILFLGYAIGQMFWGTFSDHYGRRRSLLSALSIYIVIEILVACSQNIILFSVLFFIIGFLAASLTSIGNAIIKDVYEKKRVRQIIAYIEVAMATAPVIAPIIGAHLALLFSWRAVFIALALYGAILFIYIYRYVPETLPDKLSNTKTNQSVFSVYQYLLSNKCFLVYIIVLGLLFGTFFAYLDTAPFIFIKYFGLSVTKFSWLFFLSSFTYALGAFWVSRLISKVTCYNLAWIGIILCCVGSLVLFAVALMHVRFVSLLLIGFLLSMLGFGFVLPACKAGAMTVFNHHNGSAASLMKFFQTGLCVVLLIIVSQVQSVHSLLPLAILSVFISFACCGIFQFVYKVKS
jgi:MFS transporter, DHA1 family, multidrug resistance protein